MKRWGLVLYNSISFFKLKYTGLGCFFFWNQEFPELSSDVCSKIVYAQVETVDLWYTLNSGALEVTQWDIKNHQQSLKSLI